MGSGSRDEALKLARVVIRPGRDDEEAEILARALIESEEECKRFIPYLRHMDWCGVTHILIHNDGRVDPGVCTCGLLAALRREEVRE